MEIHWSILFALEAVGTVAFASSGAMTAIDKNLDLLGIIVLGVTTAVGGGMIRDIIIGKVPPSLFVNPIYVLMALVTVLLLFAVIRFHSYLMSGFYRQTYDKIMNLFDAVGLGAFTVVGIDTAVSAGFGDYRFLAVFLGVITGVGGGILRDIMADQTPYVLCKHVYACASIAGALLYIALMDLIPADAAMVICSAVVVLIRLLAAKYRWNLPRATGKHDKGDDET